MRVSDTRKYSRLVGHYFELTTEDNQVFEIRFNKDDFKHLTGISSYLSSNDFYKNCINRIITKTLMIIKRKTGIALKAS